VSLLIDRPVLLCQGLKSIPLCQTGKQQESFLWTGWVIW